MTTAEPLGEQLPRWSVTDVHESFEARSFLDAMDRCGADVARLEALFDQHDIRATATRPVTALDGRAADEVITAINALNEHSNVTGAYIYATTSTDSYHEKAQGLMGEYQMVGSRERPLMARLAEWLRALGVDELAGVSEQVAQHAGPLTKLAARAERQMSEAEISIAVPNVDELWVAGMERQLKNSVGFDYRSWQQAATFLLDKKILLDRAEIWARSAVEAQFVGQANFLTLSTLARAQAANGKLAEAKVSMDKALSDPSASVLDIHQYGRQLLSQGEKAEALRIFLLNAKRFGDAWPIHVGLTRGYSANGDFKNALKHAKLALLKAPDELNRNSVKGMIAKLTAGKDVN